MAYLLASIGNCMPLYALLNDVQHRFDRCTRPKFLPVILYVRFHTMADIESARFALDQMRKNANC